MKYLFAIVIALSGYGFAYALTVSGVVTDSEKKKPMPNVVVGIRELQIVTETNERGEFILADVPKGFYTLTFSHKEYGIVSMPIRVKRSFRIEQILSGKIYDSGTMVKTYKDTITSTGERSITRQDIKTYPMRGMGDSTHLLQSLPGVGGGFSLATVPIIRGTNPLFNKYYIDDIPVDYPFHYAAGFVPIFSSINEEAIDTVSVVKGNAPIWTGDNLGNVIMIKSADAEKGGYHGRMILDPIVPLMPTFSLSAVPYEDLSIVAAGRRSIVDLLFDMNKSRFYFSDYYLKAAYTLSTQHRITVTGTGAKDKVYFNDLTTESGYFANGITWEYLVNNAFFVKTVVSNQNMKQAVLNSRDYTSGSGVDIKFNPDQYRLFQMATTTLKPVSIRAGYELIKYRNGCSGNMSLADIADTRFFRENTGNVKMSFPLEGHSLSGFAGIEGKHERAWYDAGVKYEYYSPLDEKAFSYNANIGYVINRETSVYAKHGRYFAHPDIQYYIGNLDPDFELAEARNFAVGTNVIPYKNIFLNAEMYYCRFYNLSPGTVFNVNDEVVKKGSQLNPFSEEKDGSTYGFELSGKGGWGGFSGWLSYSYSRSKRSNSRVSDFRSDFDQTHLLRIVLSRSFDKWTASLIWHMTSSLPYTPVVGSTPDGSSYEARYGSRNSARYAMHKRLDLKGAYNLDGGGRVFVEWWNVLFTRNNAVAEKFDDDESYSPDNPKIINDIPILIWVGMEMPL